MPKARRSFNKFLSKITNWQDSYTSLILGAIIVIVLGLLVANYFNRRSQQIGGGEQTSQSQEEAQKAVGAPQEYKIVAGDSLSAISEKFYETAEFFPVLAEVNNISNPDIIFTDSTLKVPTKNEAETVRVQLTTTQYQVQSGDTLFTISEKVYGNGSKWPILDRANDVGRLPNGNPLIFAGSTIVIPR
ncbi:hypothetical protein A2697_05590 [Candidatus Curtissbacteria bacterium RIFCSPHIGHO2_01_FULL_41_44]|uniref:LysM domain-containing protein n=1 Tax=Candidatus Curtissbacteria bacterium RIFCSPLOWO2_01_FULL_42_50 TaxID=1797730 RepID=A0A1F5H489_9BACT|nr:MAG: hypothetical protein A2697_05590 [Candidatus Curtissbacteria bacterium RIFCSPHIGHO2_01_FULL_41_44]OGD93276.1 MAG: hypothetical protein A3C33_04560 [Candidatus Curtissbacteria bacterium RIFCSPHIGHO2_02_FULL_42_58]OGD96916.1 MAG: hypothetical protein A3E71_00570 [Candidatus Curtissbacteria bacterium RIFCSPHIGHO2_12_FULL_42_33]OGD98980.1 MAG: hypothetical protein A3B54_01390 [Candidatus Curtissbacteria bacterium RIFCSPLOWO2_01_FULL_42_50]OGE03524.1 MAG: hypothetical protein A3G16_02950 [Ca